jgi:hypothetical protein
MLLSSAQVPRSSMLRLQGEGVPLTTDRAMQAAPTDLKPFRWKANPAKIIAAAARGHQTLDSTH